MFVDDGTTDANGMTVLVNRLGRRLPFYEDSFAFIEYNGRVTIIPNVVFRRSSFSSKESHISAVIDRKIVRPGETLFVKGEMKQIT